MKEIMVRKTVVITRIGFPNCFGREFYAWSNENDCMISCPDWQKCKAESDFEDDNF